MGSVLGRILVTGCSGLVGTHVVEKLLDKNYAVYRFDIVDMKKQLSMIDFILENVIYEITKCFKYISRYLGNLMEL